MDTSYERVPLQEGGDIEMNASGTPRKSKVSSAADESWEDEEEWENDSSFAKVPGKVASLAATHIPSSALSGGSSGSGLGSGSRHVSNDDEDLDFEDEEVLGSGVGGESTKSKDSNASSKDSNKDSNKDSRHTNIKGLGLGSASNSNSPGNIMGHKSIPNRSPSQPLPPPTSSSSITPMHLPPAASTAASSSPSIRPRPPSKPTPPPTDDDLFAVRTFTLMWCIFNHLYSVSFNEMY